MATTIDSGFDWTGLINTIGTQVSNVYKAVNSPSISLPGYGGSGGSGVLISGQPYVPYQQQLSSSNMSTLLLFGAVGVLVVVLLKMR